MKKLFIILFIFIGVNSVSLAANVTDNDKYEQVSADYGMEAQDVAQTETALVRFYPDIPYKVEVPYPANDPKKEDVTIDGQEKPPIRRR